MSHPSPPSHASHASHASRPLNVPVTKKRVQVILESNVLNGASTRAFLAHPAVAPFVDDDDVEHVTDRLVRSILGVGAGLLFAAVAFVIASNWSTIGGIEKMGLIAVLLLALTAAALRTGTDTLLGKSLLSLSALLSGPLLFVYGQTYQTGADPYELFLGWALLVAPYALLLDLPLLVVVDIVLFEVAFGLFVTQSFDVSLLDDAALIALAGLNGAFALIVAVVHRVRPRTGLELTSRILLVTAVAITVVPTLFELGDDGLGRALRRHEWLVVASVLSPFIALIFSKKNVLVVTVSLLSWLGLFTAPLFHAAHRALGDVASPLVGVFVLAVMLGIGALAKRLATDDDISHDAVSDDVAAARTQRPTKFELPHATVTLENVFDELRSFGVVFDRDARAALFNHHPLPLSVRVLLGLGVWMGASLVVAVVTLFDNVFEYEWVRFVVGLVGLIAAAVISRKMPIHDLRIHFTVIAVVLAEVMLGSVLPNRSRDFLPLFALMQLGVVAAVPMVLTRFTSTLLAGISLAVFATKDRIRDILDMNIFGFDASVFLLTTLVVVTCLLAFEKRISGRVTGVRAMATALTISAGVIALITTVISQEKATPVFTIGLIYPSMIAATAIAAFMVFRGETVRTRLLMSALGAFIATAVVVATWPVPLGVFGAALLAFAAWKNDKLFLVAGVVSVIVAMGFVSYSPHTAFLTKSVLAFLGGSVLVLVALLSGRGQFIPFVVDRQATAIGAAAIPSFALVRAQTPPLAAVGALLFALTSIGIPALLVVDKEVTIREGTTVFLELAPRDPRSMMQGDYMVLNYVLERDQSRRDAKAGIELIELVVDKNGVARASDRVAFGTNDDAPTQATSPLEEQTTRAVVRMKTRRHQRRLGVNAFFFEEGRADHFSQARYARVVIGRNGVPILVGLADAMLHQL